jgi:hypothetical protein
MGKAEHLHVCMGFMAPLHGWQASPPGGLGLGLWYPAQKSQVVSEVTLGPFGAPPGLSQPAHCL